MKEIFLCPCCESTSIYQKKILKFNYPGNNIQDNLLNRSYARRWILFEKILKTKQYVIFKIMICNNCGFMFLNPRLTEREIKIKYQMINVLGTVKLRSSLNPRINSEKRALRIYKLIKQNFPGKLQNRKILDYGGSWGYNLHPFVKNNKSYILDYEKWKHYKNGIKYIGKDFADLKVGDFFDIILILHTLEHVIEPYQFLKQAITYLSENGILYVEVPLGVFHETQHISEPITHLNFFSEESLVKLFDMLGLKILHMSTRNQWLINSRSLCINIIGIKKVGNNTNKKLRFKTTYYQRYNYIYYLFLAINKFQAILNKTIKKIRLIF